MTLNQREYLIMRSFYEKNSPPHKTQLPKGLRKSCRESAEAMRVGLAFHSSPQENKASICKNGLLVDPSKRGDGLCAITGL